MLNPHVPVFRPQPASIALRERESIPKHLLFSQSSAETKAITVHSEGQVAVLAVSDCAMMWDFNLMPVLQLSGTAVLEGLSLWC